MLLRAKEITRRDMRSSQTKIDLIETQNSSKSKKNKKVKRRSRLIAQPKGKHEPKDNPNCSPALQRTTGSSRSQSSTQSWPVSLSTSATLPTTMQVLLLTLNVHTTILKRYVKLQTVCLPKPSPKTRVHLTVNQLRGRADADFVLCSNKYNC